MKVGDVARRTREVTARDIELFTELTGDRNPLHYDPDLAARSRFGGIVVQGGVTSGLLNALVAEQLPGPGSVFLRVDWSFRAPVRPGDVITAEARVLETREDKPVTTLATTITNQAGVVVLDGTAVVWRDPVVAEGSAAVGEGHRPLRCAGGGGPRPPAPDLVEVTQPGRRAASATATRPAADMASSDTGGPTARTTSASSSTLASIP